MNSNIPAPLKKLAQKLEVPDSIDFNFLKKAVAETKLRATDLKPFALFNHPAEQSYGRHLLYDSPKLKIFLMCWAPGDFTAIHDHGSTEWGCVIALGDFTHRIYYFKDGQLTVKSADPFRQGQVACLTGELIHMMGNSGNSNIMSLHIYGTDSGNETLAKMSRVYLPEKDKVVMTNGPAFLNCPAAAIIKEGFFNSICPHALQDYLKLIKLRSDKYRENKVHKQASKRTSTKTIRQSNMPEEIDINLKKPAMYN
jgi:cysteine dioxygenase